MQLFVYSASHKDAVESVDVARWEQYPEADGFPFKAMWYCIPPNEKGPQDQHPEIELSLVMRGTATVETGGRRSTVEQGDSFLLGSQEAHTVSNLSADEPLLVFSAYWMPPATTGDGTGDE